MLQSTIAGATNQPDLRQLLENLYQGRYLRTFPAGHMIPLQTHEIWIVSRGVALLSTLYPSGDEALLGLASPSMPFGLPLTLIHPYQAMALSTVDAMCLNMVEVEQSPPLAQELFRSVTRRLRQTEAILAMSGCRRVDERLRQLLSLLQVEVGHPTETGIRLNVRLTHQHLASAIGTTRVTITRLLGQLREEGKLIVDDDRHLVVPYDVTL